MTHRELCEMGALWLTKCVNWRFRCPHVVIEIVSAAQENPDIFGLRGANSICFEVKVSRSDFFADLKKESRKSPELGIGNTRYYLTPKELILPSEIKNGWGLVWFDGKNFEVVKESDVFVFRNYASELNLLQSIIRRQSGKNKVLDFRVKK